MIYTEECKSIRIKHIQIVLRQDIIIEKVVYFESYDLIADAFGREKQVKAGSRKKKIALIESTNPEWKDLSDQVHSNSVEELIRLKKFFK